MLNFVARQAARSALGLVGAALLAALISAIAVPHARGLLPLLAAAGIRFVEFLQLDFGRSAISGLPALEELALHLPATLVLVSAGAGLALAAGVPLGVLLSIGPARRAAAPLVQILAAAPVFCGGLVLAYGAVHLLHWPVSVNAPAGTLAAPGSPGELELFAPPLLMVGFAGAAAVQLSLRRAASLSSGESFRTGLRRMGLSALEIERVYVMPQVIAGLLAAAGEIMLALLSSAVVAEWVFHRPGAADLFVKSVALDDWNMVAMILFAFAGLSFLADFFGRIGGHLLANEGAS
jgi:peptide/nickel transport system permease protein